MVRFLSHLDMENVNETVARRAVEAMDAGKPLPEPNRQVRHLLGRLRESDTIELGQDLDRLNSPARLATGTCWRCLRVSATCWIMKDGAGKENPLTAVVQAIHLERLAATPKYAAQVAQGGSDAGDFWLVPESLARARAQTPALLQRLGALGWAKDLVNFRDTEVRVTDDDLRRPLQAGTPALP